MEAPDHPRRKYEFVRDRLSRLRAEAAEIEARMKEVAANLRATHPRPRVIALRNKQRDRDLIKD